jgi:hypothetical protein
VREPHLRTRFSKKGLAAKWNSSVARPAARTRRMSSRYSSAARSRRLMDSATVSCKAHAQADAGKQGAFLCAFAKSLSVRLSVCRPNCAGPTSESRLGV